MKRSEEIQELVKALSATQGELTPADKGTHNPHLKTYYADLSAVWAVLREVLPRNGLAIVQTILPRDDGKVAVLTTLMHISGQWISSECVLPVPKQDPQGHGSAITYAKRYGLCAMMGVVAEKEDDDGHDAGQDCGNKKPGNQPRRAPVKNQPPIFDTAGAISRINAASSFEELKAVYAACFNDAKAAGIDYTPIVQAKDKRKAELTPSAPPENGAPPITDPQSKAIMAYYKDTPRQARLDDMSAFLGRKVETFSSLTFADAHDFLDALNRDKQEAANG